MSGLVLKLKPRERLLVNGVILENGDRATRLKVRTRGAHILRLSDALHPDDAATPVRRTYYVAQLAAAGEAEDAAARAQLLEGLGALAAALPSAARDIDAAAEAAREGRYYVVMRRLRRLFELERELLGESV
jgi:flagellar protein FlbT